MSLVTSGNNMFLNFTPVPEPASVLAISATAGGLGLLMRRLRTGRRCHSHSSLVIR
jgi:hypothetical protein